MIEPPPQSPPPAVVVSLCEVVARPELYDGKILRVSGAFVADWRHGVAIAGQPCDAGVMLGGDDRNWGEPWARIRATRTTSPQPDIRLTVEGRFRWRPDATWREPARAIEVDRIEDLEITPR